MSAGAFARLCDLGAKTFYDQMVESADLEQIEHVHFRQADADYGEPSRPFAARPRRRHGYRIRRPRPL